MTIYNYIQHICTYIYINTLYIIHQSHGVAPKLLFTLTVPPDLMHLEAFDVFVKSGSCVRGLPVTEDCGAIMEGSKSQHVEVGERLLIVLEFEKWP